MAIDFKTHPCFSPEAHRRFARVHLPVAPDCNVGCNFCNRKFDCPNESRPGVSSTLLAPYQAVAYLKRLTDVLDSPISVVGIAGPGDPFANSQATMETLRLVRDAYPDMLLCVATNGLGLTPHVSELADLHTGHVTVTVNAVDPEIGAKIYRFVRLKANLYRGIGGAELLLARQLEGIRALKARNITVKINTIIIPGVNDAHVEQVAKRMAELGADIHNCIPLFPVPGTPFGELTEPDAEMMAKVRAVSSPSLPQMTHCARCRADAAGMLGEDNHELVRQVLEDAALLPLASEHDRPYTAVASLEGMLVNQHLGEAEQLWIFFRDADGQFHPVETRPAPLPGGGDDRWEALGKRLTDCRTLVCSSAGQRPKIVLARGGVRVLVAEGLIEEALDAVYGGRKPRMPARVMKPSSGCDSDGVGCGGCTGTGTGCG